MTDLQNILTNPLMQRAGWALLHFLWQGAAVAALLAGATLLLRRRSANLRYIIACSALLLMLALPATTMWLVKPPTGAMLSPEGREHVASINMPIPGGRACHPPYEPSEEPPVHRPANAEVPDGEAFAAPADSALYEASPRPAAPAASVEPAQSWHKQAGELVRPALPWIVCGWLIGVLTLSGWHVRGWMQVRRLRRVGVRSVGREITEVLARLCNRLGIGQAVRVVESALVCVPTVVGWLKPIILLPASALTGLTGEQLEAILAHELAHIRRHDYLINLLQTAAETLLFYHPAAWWVSRRIRAERENCCDDLAVAASGRPLVYARALTAVAKMSLPRPRLAVAADGGGKFLTRIRRIIGLPTDKPNHRGRWLAGAFTLLTVLTIVITLTVSCATDKPPSTQPAGSALQGFDRRGDGVNGLRARIAAGPNLTKQLGIDVSVPISNVSTEPLAVDFGNYRSISWELLDSKGQPVNAIGPSRQLEPVSNWFTISPGQTITMSVTSPTESNGLLLDLRTVNWNLQPGKYTLMGVFEVKSPTLHESVRAKVWTGRIELSPITFEVVAEVSDEEVLQEVHKVRAAHGDVPERMWPALAGIVKPGFTYRQVKMVLPPRPGSVSIWGNMVRFRLDDQFYVEALAVVPRRNVDDPLVLTQPPQIKQATDDPVFDSLCLTIRPDIQKLIDAVTSRHYGRIKLPAPSMSVNVGVTTEVFGAWESYKNLGLAKTNADVSRAVQELIRVKAVWCLSTGLCHRNKDVQIRCARALGDLKGIRPARFLLTVAHANAVYVEGSESASIHGTLQHALAKALNTIFGTSVHLKEGQDPEGLKAGIKVWSAALAKKEKTDYVPLVKVLQDWPAKGVYDVRQSPFFQALATLARRQKLNNKDYLPCGFVPAANGRIKVFRSGNEEILVAIIGNDPMTLPGTSAQQIVLLDKTGKILDSLGCMINSRYGLISTVFKDKPDPDGARMVITFPSRRWHNWHRIAYRGKTYTFQEDERNQPPEWDRKGLCRIGIKNRRLVVLFPTLWPRPGGSELEFRLVASKRGSVLENVERYIKELTTRGPKAANSLIDGFRWFEIQCEAPSLSVAAKYGGREYILLSNVQRQIMLSHSTGPKGKAWGLKRVYLSKDARGRPAVAFVLDADGARLFQTFTETYQNNVLATLVDGKVLSTATIRPVASGQGVIEGNFTDQQARNLVEALNAGMVNDPNSPSPRILKPVKLMHWQAYSRVTDFFLHGGSRAEAAERFAAVARDYPNTRSGKRAAELSRRLREMVKEDAEFKKPADPSKLTGQEKIDYLVYQLRDVAARGMILPGETYVLQFAKRFKGTKDRKYALMAKSVQPAEELRKMGKVAVPTLLKLLDDERLTRASDCAMNGGYVLRYRDVALQILDAISGRRFFPDSGTGDYLSNVQPAEKRKAIIARVNKWWEKNKHKTESQWLREALTEQRQSRPGLPLRAVRQ